MRPLTAMSAIDVAAGLVFRDGLLLITQRRRGDHLAGLWEFPGGKREPDESFEQCLRRELREELDVGVEVLDLIEAIAHDYAEKSVNLRFYRCRLLDSEPRAIGCADLRWVRREDLFDYTFPAADERLLERLSIETGHWAMD